MSKSFHTDPAEVIARRRLERDAGGDAALPRLVVRKPYAGDVHPLSKGVLRRKLRLVPEKYLYGLDRIELRAREGGVGDPFGLYRIRENAVILYSLPEVWRMPSAGSWLLDSLRRYYADVRAVDGGLEVRWPAEGVMAMWFFFEVVAHELGHHYAERYRRRRRVPVGVAREEIVADLHARRIFEAEWKRWKAHREGVRSGSP